MQRKESSKAVTTRFSTKDYLQIQELAEEQGSSIADIIRDAWAQRLKYEQSHQQLIRLEQRLRITVFEMLCTVVGVNDDERKLAKQTLHNRGVKW